MPPKATIKGTEDFKAFFIVEKYTKLCITQFCYCFIFKKKIKKKKTIQMRGVEIFPFSHMLNERDSDIYTKTE